MFIASGNDMLLICIVSKFSCQFFNLSSYLLNSCIIPKSRSLVFTNQAFEVIILCHPTSQIFPGLFQQCLVLLLNQATFLNGRLHLRLNTHILILQPVVEIIFFFNLLKFYFQNVYKYTIINCMNIEENINPLTTWNVNIFLK